MSLPASPASTTAPSPTAPRRIYLVRHGDVTYFDPDRGPVHPDTVSLNVRGREQAQATAAILTDIPFDRVVTSPLLRTQETARLLLGRRELTCETREAFGEIRPGSLASITLDSAERLLTGAFTSDVHESAQFLGGETYGDFLARVLPAFERLVAEPDWRHLLIVAHGGVNRAILTHVLGAGLAGFAHIEQDAACLNIIDVMPQGHYLLRLLNFTAYSAAKRGIEWTTMQSLFHEFRDFWHRLSNT